MTETEKRIFELARLIGVDTQPGSKVFAELKGYCAGFKLISDDFADLPYQLSPYTAQGYALDLFCSMMGISASESEEEKRRQIIQGLGKKFGGCLLYDFIGELNDIFLICISNSFKVSLQTIDGDSIINCDGEKTAGSLLKNYIPPGARATFNGSGVTFDRWEGLSYTFDKYDSLDLTFDLLDTIT